MKNLYTLKWENTYITILDQSRLPDEIIYRSLTTPREIYDAIASMQVRGAPAIGITAAYGMVLAAQICDENKFYQELECWGNFLKQARPTAVNLMWAVDRMLGCAADAADQTVTQIKQCLLNEALKIENEDKEANRQIGSYLLSLMHPGDTLLTHCNAGALAASAYGTALAVFYVAKERGISLKAYADETRPWLQGARLTAFELQKAGIDVTLICDNMAAFVMSQGKIDAIVTGCDRVAANGDTANKIGTLNVSILAKYYQIPFYVAAPTSTIDRHCPDGSHIPIEERNASEIIYCGGQRVAPDGIKVYNPAFDITPGNHITAIITEKGILYPPYEDSIRRII